MTASAWLNDLRNQIERTRILSTVYRSASALGSHLPSIASARAKVAGAGAILRPVSNGTQVESFLLYGKLCALSIFHLSLILLMSFPLSCAKYHLLRLRRLIKIFYNNSLKSVLFFSELLAYHKLSTAFPFPL